MKTNTGNRASPDWRSLYEVAVLELDLVKIPQRINEAQHAIADRVERLRGSEDSVESEALMNALNVLHDLGMMARERKTRI